MQHKCDAQMEQAYMLKFCFPTSNELYISTNAQQGTGPLKFLFLHRDFHNKTKMVMRPLYIYSDYSRFGKMVSVMPDEAEVIGY